MTINPAFKAQTEAAHPGRNTWLSANAGSGKTRVLTDRVARLLLNGVEPQHVLCLTYTKAAAAEMRGRVGKRLGEWALADEAKLSAKLEDLTGDIEAVIFPRVYKEKPELWEADKAVVLSGRVQEKDGELKFLVETGYEITPDNIEEIARYVPQNEPSKQEEAAAANPKQIQAVTVRLRAHLPQTILLKLRQVFDGHPGQYRVYFSVDNAGGQQKILSSYRIKFDELVAKELEAILGPDTVKVEA